MSDLISRQAAIDAFEAYKNCIKAVLGDENELIKIVITCRNIIDELPSAQSEIIRCEECMHNGSFDTDCPIDWAGKEYCSFAERRTDDT